MPGKLLAFVRCSQVKTFYSQKQLLLASASAIIFSPPFSIYSCFPVGVITHLISI